MKKDACLMSFEELLPYLRAIGIEDWYKVLTVHYSDALTAHDELDERLRNTWWEIRWPDGAKSTRPTCRYLADSLRDALRLRPSIPLSAGSVLNNTGRDFLELLDLWEDEEDEYVEYCCCD